MSTINTYNDIFRRDILEDKFNEIDATIYTAEVAITAADIVAMYTTAVEVIAAPGAGKALHFVDAALIYDYDTATYTGGGVITLEYAAGAAVSTDIAAANGFGAAGDKVFSLAALNASGGYTMPVNTAIDITNATGVFVAPTGAAGIARLKVTYRVVTTGL